MASPIVSSHCNIQHLSYRAADRIEEMENYLCFENHGRPISFIRVGFFILNPASPSLGFLGGLLLSEEVPVGWRGRWVGQFATESLQRCGYWEDLLSLLPFSFILQPTTERVDKNFRIHQEAHLFGRF